MERQQIARLEAELEAALGANRRLHEAMLSQIKRIHDLEEENCYLRIHSDDSAMRTM